MVKVYGPMMSLDASGTLGKAVTYSKWKGRNYVRERVIPSNPKSGAQVGRRSMFTFLSQNWALITDGKKATWEDLADQIVCPPYNAFVKEGMANWHNFLAPSQDTPTTRGDNASDNALTAAAWEENRIKLTIEGTSANLLWGIIIFGTPGAAITPSVGNAVIAEIETTIAEHFIFWTPPNVEQYTFETIAFSVDGKQAAAGGPQTATP